MSSGLAFNGVTAGWEQVQLPYDKADTIAWEALDKNKRKNLFETANGRSVGSSAFTRSIRSTVPGIQMNLFETGIENHLNDADFFQLVSNSRQVGVWKDDITGCR